MPTTKVSTSYNESDFMIVNNLVRGMNDDLRKGIYTDIFAAAITYLKKVPKRDNRTGQALRLLQQGAKMWNDWCHAHPGVAPKGDAEGEQMIAKRNALFRQAVDMLGETLGRTGGFQNTSSGYRTVHAVRKAKEEGYQDGYDDGIEACLDFKKKDDKKSLPVRHGEFTHSQAIQYLRQFVNLNRSVLYRKQVPEIANLEAVCASLRRLVDNDVRVVNIINKIKDAIRSLSASQSFAASGRPMADYNAGYSRGVGIAKLRDSIDMADKLAKEMEIDEKWDAIGKPKPIAQS